MNNGDLKEILISTEQINKRIQEMGKQISADYAGKEVLVICVLRGAVIFMSDLIRALDVPAAIDFMAVSSYGVSTVSSGVVRILKDLDEEVEGKHLLVVEDIIDTGLTLNYLIENLKSRKPASVKVCTMLSKPSRRKVDVQMDYNGFTIPDEFVVGYGLDYAEKYRNLPYIAVLDPNAYKK